MSIELELPWKLLTVASTDLEIPVVLCHGQETCARKHGITPFNYPPTIWYDIIVVIEPSSKRDILVWD